MYETIERRQLILNILCERRYETMDNLALEFSVHRNTIRKDVEVLSFYFPLYTTKGTGGGVYIVDGFRLGMKYLTDKQSEVLERLSKAVGEKDAEILQSIIKTFKKPTRKNNKGDMKMK